MYKLENNVAWTNDLKDAFKHGITRAKIIYNNGNEDIVIDEETGISDITLEDSVLVPRSRIYRSNGCKTSNININ